jgi:hypothetical protein
MEAAIAYSLFMQWVVAFSLVDEAGVRYPQAVTPEHWPPYWWWECECGRRPDPPW